MVHRGLVVVVKECVFIVAVVSQSFTKVSGFGVPIKVRGMVEDMVTCVPDLLENDVP
jgi:hypothetical protein